MTMKRLKPGSPITVVLGGRAWRARVVRAKFDVGEAHFAFSIRADDWYSASRGVLSYDGEGITWCRGHGAEAGNAVLAAAALAGVSSWMSAPEEKNLSSTLYRARKIEAA